MTLALGIDVGATKVAAGLVELETGRVRGLRTSASEPARGGAALLEDCVRLAHELTSGIAVTAVGVAVCEVVDTDGRITSAQSFDWRSLDVAGALADVAPVRLESDVRAAARAESVFGAGRGRGSFLFVNAGSGISSTLVLDGVPYVGARGNAILLGAGPLDVEAVASGVALRARHGSPPEELSRAAAEGDPDAVTALEAAGTALGEAIAFAVNLLDPEIVVVGGGLALGSALYTAATERAMRAQIWAENARRIPFLRAGLGSEAGSVGAALAAGLRRG